jgi:SOS response associated peptidase (SRAP)
VCNLYSLHKKREMLARFFRVSHNRSVVFEPLPAVFPGHVAPVVREDADGERQIVLMSWGFVLLQKDRAPRRVTNVRDDKILESRFWRGSLRNDAVWCQPHPSASPMATSSGDLALVGLRGSGERPLFAFAGIWRRYEGTSEERWPEAEPRRLRLPDYDTQPIGGDHQPRKNASLADARGGIRDLA